MILIESIKTRHIPGPFAHVAHFPEPGFCAEPGSMTEDGYVETELVIAEHFRTAEGAEIQIGMTEKVQNVLGLPMTAFTKQRDFIDTQHRTIVRLGGQLKRYETLAWWQRLVWLFKGGPLP